MSTADVPVLHGEFDEFEKTVERRLDGHDTLYSEVKKMAVALAEFTGCLKGATDKITDALKADDDQAVKCTACKASLEGKINDLNVFRWNIVGALAFVIGIPAIGSFVILILKISEGGLR